MGIAGMIGPLIFTAVFSAAISPTAAVKLPGAPFLLATGLHILAIVVCWWCSRKCPCSSKRRRCNPTRSQTRGMREAQTQ